MGERENKLEALGYPLADTPKAAGLYTPVVMDGKTAYLSGAVPVKGGSLAYAGKVPGAVSEEDAKKAAEICAANLLRVYIRDVGSLDTIDHVVKITGFVNSDPDFINQHLVMNGASKLLLDVLGEAGHHARSAVGMAGLPTGAAVEVEMIVRVK